MLLSFLISHTHRHPFPFYDSIGFVQGHVDPVREVNLQKTNCWTTIFKKDEEYRLLVFYQTGSIEIRLIFL